MLVLIRLLALCRPCAVSAQVGRSISGIPVECLPHVACILGVLAFVLTGVSWGSCADFCVAQHQFSCSCPCCPCCPCCPAASGHSVLTVSWLLTGICCCRRIGYSLSSAAAAAPLLRPPRACCISGHASSSGWTLVLSKLRCARNRSGPRHWS
jgi:hypothetical protein